MSIPESKSTLLLADDHRIVLDGVKGVLEGHAGFMVVGVALDGPSAVAQAEALKPDLLLLDVSMPGMSGVEVAHRIPEVSPGTRVVVYSMDVDRETVDTLVQAGVAGYVIKDESIRVLREALETVAGGKTYFSSAVTDIVGDFPESGAAPRLLPL